MRDYELETLVVAFFGLAFSLLGIGSTFFCIKNPTEVTSANWVGSIILAVGGIGMLIFSIVCIVSELKRND